VGARCSRQWGPSTVHRLLGRNRQADREARWACLSTARSSLAGWHGKTKFITLPSSPAGWILVWVHTEQRREGVGPELLILPAEPLPAGQHWGRVVTSNVTQVRRRASAICLDFIHERRGPQVPLVSQSDKRADLLWVGFAAKKPPLFVRITLTLAIRKGSGGNIPLLVVGALPKGKGSTSNPDMDYCLPWDLAAQQSQTTEGH